LFFKCKSVLQNAKGWLATTSSCLLVAKKSRHRGRLFTCS
jgi:hypothetical protein